LEIIYKFPTNNFVLFRIHVVDSYRAV